LLSRLGCDHPCVSFVFSCGYLKLFYLLVVCLCLYVCSFCCLGAVLFSDCLCKFLYLRVLFSVFLCFIMFCGFGFWFCWCYGSFTHNEDIVRSRCGGGEPCSCFLETKIKNFKKIFLLLVVFGSFVLYLIGIDPLKLDYLLVHK